MASSLEKKHAHNELYLPTGKYIQYIQQAMKYTSATELKDMNCVVSSLALTLL